MIAALVTAYKPDAGFVSRFQPLLPLCGAVVVIDNTPGGHRFDLPAGFVVLQRGENAGLARALNDGLARARELGADEVVLFDQDSTPTPELIGRLSAALIQGIAQFGPKCCVAPTHLDDGVPQTAAPPRPGAAPMGHNLSPVTCLPTSGMTFALRGLGDGDVFSPEFFLDLVDFEWCWRLGHHGWTFLRATDITMFHRLGLAQRKFLGLTHHVPAPYRHYFQVRDTLKLTFRGYVPTYAKVRLIGILPLKALVYPFILDHGLERLTWMLRGVRDCVRGVEGIGAAAARLSK